MSLPSENQDRSDVEVAILDALVTRADEGMTVLEIRAAVDADIDDIETALASLKTDRLITAVNEGGAVRIQPADHIVTDSDSDGNAENGLSLVDVLREKLGF